jgi:plasmid maintenance system antidote protein VapI
MTTNDYLDAIGAKYGLTTDYKIAAMIGITRNAVSNYRHGRTCFDDTTAIRVADLLDLDQEEVLLSCHMERALTPETKAVWARALRRMQSAAASAVIAVTAAGGLSVSPPAEASNNYQPVTLFIMSTCRRTFAALAKALGIRPLSVVF